MFVKTIFTLPCAGQIFILQKAETASAFCKMKKKMLRAKLVIRATSNRNLQSNICCATSCKKMLLVLLGLKARNNAPFT